MCATIAKWLDAHADPDWRNIHRLHSVWVASFWAIVAGLWIALPAFEYMVDPLLFAVLCIGFSLAIMVARFTKQPGLPDV